MVSFVGSGATVPGGVAGFEGGPGVPGEVAGFEGGPDVEAEGAEGAEGAVEAVLPPELTEAFVGGLRDGPVCPCPCPACAIML
jgi:hypothetical protein